MTEQEENKYGDELRIYLSEAGVMIVVIFENGEVLVEVDAGKELALSI